MFSSRKYVFTLEIARRAYYDIKTNRTGATESPSFARLVHNLVAFRIQHPCHRANQNYWHGRESYAAVMQGCNKQDDQHEGVNSNAHEPQLSSPRPMHYDDVIDTGNAEQHGAKKVSEARRRRLFARSEATLKHPNDQ
jgi:hypothetical protein